MDDVLVGSLMSAPVRTVTPAESVGTAARTMIEHDISSVVVVDDDNEAAGILTSTDYVHIVADDASAATDVSAYMTTEVITATVNDPVADVAETMVDRGVHHVPVVDDAAGVVGMIATTDFAAYVSNARTPSPPRTGSGAGD